MADYTQTATSVVLVSGTTGNGTAGGTIVAGNAIYLNATDGFYYVCDVDDTAAKAAVVGIALHGSTANQPITFALPEAVVNLGATLAVTDVIIISDDGALAPVADLASGDYLSIVGHAQTTANCKLLCEVTGFQKS